MVRVDYECEDGTPFPVEFTSADHAAGRWILDPEHTPKRLTPMAEALIHLADAGAQRAYAEVGMSRPDFFEPGPRANGYAYFFTGAPDRPGLGDLLVGCTALVKEHGSGAAVWRDRCLPQVEKNCAEMDAASLDTPLAEIAELDGHAQHLTMLPAYIIGHDLQQLAEVIAGTADHDSLMAAANLVAGRPTTTIAADHELWALGRAALADDQARRLLEVDDPVAALAELRERGGAGAFLARFDAFLATYGGRSEGWEVGFPIWRELGPGFWSVLRAAARPGAADPAATVAGAQAERDALRASIEARLADDPDKLARFRRRLERCADYIPVREERAHWQLVATGCVRTAVLRRGEALTARGIIDQPLDVLFLLPEEVEAPAGDDLRALVGTRRAEHLRWSAVVPPAAVGSGPDHTAAPARAPAAGQILTGLAGSPGVASGRVRIVRDLDEADQVEAGDVLVCRTTCPPWTPLFGLAAAVVTESGDSGSHASIAAREYGIPCVVGAARAMDVLIDGGEVTVDGTAGTVTAR